MSRPVGNIGMLEEIITEAIYYAQDSPPSDVKFFARLEADETTDIYRVEDVQEVIARYFHGEHYDKALFVINHLAREYGWQNGFIPEEVLFDGQGAIPYHLGTLPFDRKMELDKMDEENDEE